MREESLEPLEESKDDSQEHYRILEENHRKMRELLDRAAELVAEMHEGWARNEKPC